MTGFDEAWPNADPADLHRFAGKVFRHRSIECWLWTGGLTPDGGYGRFRSSPIGVMSAHRWSYLAAYRTADQPVIRHDCDVRCCVNPGHLRIGTQADNIADTIARGNWARYARTGPTTWPDLAFTLRDAARRADVDAIVRLLARPEQLSLLEFLDAQASAPDPAAATSPAAGADLDIDVVDVDEGGNNSA